jgi:iron complex transport system substrate-binding protein
VRIVSLLPSATEIVYAIGLDQELVAVTDECDWPRPAADKPKVSRSALPPGLAPADVDRAVAELVAAGQPLYTLDAERIRRLQPDLILAQDLCRVCAVPSGQVEDALATLGCRAEVVSLDPTTLDEVIGCLTAVGRAAGYDATARAQGLERALRQRLAAVEEAVAGSDRPRPRTLALEWAEPPFAGGHWVPDMVEAAGGQPVLGRAGQPSARVSWDEVAEAGPEVVVFMPCGYRLPEVLAQCDQLRQQPAISGARLLAVDASNYFSRPSPRIVEGVEALAWALHPDAVPAPPPGRVAEV